MELINKLKVFEKMYDNIRVVDPVGKRVYVYNENTIHEEQGSCFDFWKRNEICKNCISMRAYNENETFVKIEYNENNIFIVTAIPINIKQNKLIVEILKNITDSLYVNNDLTSNIVDVYSLVKDFNRIATKDTLTNIFNLRYLHERFPAELINVVAYEKPLSVIFADLDHFKNVNDTYGHIAGDLVLKGFAEILESSIRKEKDWASRYGGEEFLICLTDTNHEEALAIAERMRQKTQEHIFQYENDEIRVTASFGVFTIDKVEDFYNLDYVVNKADEKLYEAKNSGRNTVK